MVGILVWLLLLAAAVRFDRGETERYQTQVREAVARRLRELGAAVTSAVAEPVMLQRGLATYVSHNPDITPAEYASCAAQLLAQSPGLRALDLAHHDILSHVYPVKGNQAALGLDLANQPDQQECVRRARRERRIVLAGPVDLVQGGRAFIGRMPIFESPAGQPPESGPYWGQASVLIDCDRLYQATGLKAAGGDLQLAIRGQDGLGAEGATFYGDPELFTQPAETLLVQLPGGTWQLAALPLGGWPRQVPLAAAHRAGAAGLLVLLALLFVSECRHERRRQEIETALGEANRFLGALLQNLPGMVFRRDLDETAGIVFVSQGALALTGWEPNQLLRDGAPQYDELILPSDRERVARALAKVVEEGGTYELQYQLRAADGALREVWEQGQGVLGPDGRVAYLEGYATDVTETARLAAMEERVREQLHQTSKMEAIAQLARGVAHDFNNLLTSISGYADLLSQGIADEALRQDALEIRRAANRARSLTHQLLAFGRRQPSQPVVCDFNVLVEGLAPTLAALLGEQVAVKLDLAPELDFVELDPRQFEEVLMSLAANARAAMPDGGQFLLRTRVVERDGDSTSGEQLPPGRYVELQVADTGEGMTPEVQAKLFEPFFTTRPLGEGTGLGLAAVYGIVQQSHGVIECRSAPGEGACFVILLPAVSERGAFERSRLDRGETPEPTGPLVLVVDDEPGILQFVEGALSDSGYRVMVAESGPAALALLEPGVELLLTDVIMKGMSGPELVATVRRQRPELPVLYMSGYTEMAMARAGLIEPVERLLHKPFRINDLLAAVEQCLAQEPPSSASNA